MTSPKLATTTTNGRLYRHPITGVEYPSVTTILNVIGKGEALKHWAAGEVAKYAVNQKQNWIGLDDTAAIDLLKREPLRSLDRAASRGTDVHSIAEAFARTGTMPTWADEISGYVDALRRFFDEHQPQPLLIEQTVFNSEIGYAGSFDMVCKLATFGDATVMLDYKTSKAVYPDVAAQLAAYANGLEYIDGNEQTHPMPVCTRGVVVRFAVDGEYEVVEVDLDAGWRYFKAVRSVHAIPTKPLLLGKVKPHTVDNTQLQEQKLWLTRRVKNIKDNYPQALQQLVALWSPTMPTFKTDHSHTVLEIRTIERWLNTCEGDHVIPFVDGKPVGNPPTPKPAPPKPRIAKPKPFEGLEVDADEVTKLRTRLNMADGKTQNTAKRLAKEASEAKLTISMSGKPTMRRALLVSFMLDAIALGSGDSELLETVMTDNGTRGTGTLGAALGALEMPQISKMSAMLEQITAGTAAIKYNNTTNLYEIEKESQK